MSTLNSPKVPPFRTTLFFGPEYDELDSCILYCVFNVKKRSWKGGVQIVVEINETQVSRVRSVFKYDQWLDIVLSHLSQSEQTEYLKRGHNLLVQQICQTKLQLAIGLGLPQKNSKVTKDSLIAELDEVLEKEEVFLKDEILRELDIQTFE